MISFKHAAIAAALVLVTGSTAFAAPAVTRGETAMLDGAHPDATVVATLAGGEAVNVVDCNYDWCLVRSDSANGWVTRNKLRFGAIIGGERTIDNSSSFTGTTGAGGVIGGSPAGTDVSFGFGELQF